MSPGGMQKQSATFQRAFRNQEKKKNIFAEKPLLIFELLKVIATFLEIAFENPKIVGDAVKAEEPYEKAFELIKNCPENYGPENPLVDDLHREQMMDIIERFHGEKFPHVLLITAKYLCDLTYHDSTFNYNSEFDRVLKVIQDVIAKIEDKGVKQRGKETFLH